MKLKKQTLKSIFVLVISLLLSGATAFAQEGNKEEIKKEPLYRGTYISADLFGIGSKLFGSDFLSSEINVAVNLKNQFFPALEAGYGTTDTNNEEKGIHYKSSAPYFRLGLNFNTMFKKKSESFLYVGVRYGITSFSYDVNGTLKDPIWGDEYPFSHDNQKSTFQWFEALVGVNVQIYKNFHMGWAVRYKVRLSVKDNPYTDPWYIPGFGANKSSNIGVTYSLTYKLPF